MSRIASRGSDYPALTQATVASELLPRGLRWQRGRLFAIETVSACRGRRGRSTVLNENMEDPGSSRGRQAASTTSAVSEGAGRGDAPELDAVITGRLLQ